MTVVQAKVVINALLVYDIEIIDETFLAITRIAWIAYLGLMCLLDFTASEPTSSYGLEYLSGTTDKSLVLPATGFRIGALVLLISLILFQYFKPVEQKEKKQALKVGIGITILAFFMVLYFKSYGTDEEEDDHAVLAIGMWILTELLLGFIMPLMYIRSIENLHEFVLGKGRTGFASLKRRLHILKDDLKGLKMKQNRVETVETI